MMARGTHLASVATGVARWAKGQVSRISALAKAAMTYGRATLVHASRINDAPAGQRGRLFRKYAALLVSLVGGALLINGPPASCHLATGWRTGDSIFWDFCGRPPPSPTSAISTPKDANRSGSRG